SRSPTTDPRRPEAARQGVAMVERLWPRTGDRAPRALHLPALLLVGALAGSLAGFARGDEAARDSIPVPRGLRVGDGSASFLVAPTRVVLEGSRRTAELNIVNTGTRTATFRVSLVHMRMLENGDIAEVADVLPGESVADSLIRYSPRQVTLEPTRAQTVRIQVIKRADLPAGEYRSHLLV